MSEIITEELDIDMHHASSIFGQCDTYMKKIEEDLSVDIYSNGENIYPEEIESKLNNMPYVSESIVIQYEDHLVALVYPDYTAVDQSHLKQQGLIDAMEVNRKNLNAQLAAYEQVVKIKLYPHEFEKTPKRSIKRFLYTQMAGE